MKRDLNCPHICPSSQNALNLLHFPRRFDIIRKHGKLVWLSRQSDSLVMNRSAVRIRPPAPHSRKASIAAPRKVLRGVCVCACACVYASQKYGRSPRSSFLCVAPKLSRCSLIFASRFGRLAPPSFMRMSGFPCSPWAYSYRSLTQVYPTRKSQIFPRGTPTSPARLRSQIRCAACAIPSRSRSLRIRPPAPHRRKASIAAPRKVLRGVCVFTPAENQRFSPGDPDIYHTHIVKARFLRERVETLLYVKISLSRNIPLCNIKCSYINIFSAV